MGITSRDGDVAPHGVGSSYARPTSTHARPGATGAQPVAFRPVGTLGPMPTGRGSTHAAVARLMAMLVAFALISFLTVTSTRAAFSGATGNAANSILAGAIVLSDNDAGVAMFDEIAGLVPGVVAVQCIDVTFVGAADTDPIGLYVPSLTGTLAPYLDVVVEVGSGAAGFGDCTGFTASTELYRGTLGGLAAAHDAYATALTTWTPATSPDTRSFRFSAEVRPEDAAQGRSTTFEVAWEVRSR